MARCMPISLVTFRLSPTRRPSMSTTTISEALSRNLLIAVGRARMRSWLRRTDRFPAVPGTKPNRYSHLPNRASCLRCTDSADRSGAVELKAMLRVVVKPLFSRAVECIRHQIPVFSCPSQFPTEREETQQGKRRWREIRPGWVRYSWNYRLVRGQNCPHGLVTLC